MIPNNSNVATVQSNIEGISGQFSMDENSLAHLMSILTNMYSDPEMAVVREYVTNAFDSHVEAGQTRPIEIVTPSPLSRTYVVRDFGVGMSVDDLINTYSKYGASTKRDSDAVVGMLGIGSKSALTYTNQFTIIAVKEGVRAQAIVSVNDDGVPVFHIVDTSSTDECNGVTISIPVKDSNTFAQKTAAFLQFWDEGLVLVNGKPPAKHDYRKVKPGLFIKPGASRYNRPGSYIVMGNVSYLIDNEHLPPTVQNNSFGFVAYVPIGSVNIAPSREALNYTPRTVRLLKELSEGIYDEYVKTVVSDFNDIKKPLDAIKAYRNLDYNLKRHNSIMSLTFEGHLIRQFENTLDVPNTRLWWDYADRSKTMERQRMIDIGMIIENSLLVVGSLDKPYPTLRRQIYKYVVDNNLSKTVYLVETDPAAVWLRDIKRVSLDDIKKIVLPKAVKTPSAPRRKNIPYDTYRLDNDVVVFESTSSITGKIAYVSPATLNGVARYDAAVDVKDFLKYLPDYTIAVMGKNRFDKFIKAYPSAVSINTAVRNAVADMGKQVTDQVTIEDLPIGVAQFVNRVDILRIHDLDLVSFISALRTSTVGKTLKQIESLRILAYRATISMQPLERTVPAPYTDNYPLLGAIGSNIHDDVYLYLNAKFAEMEKNNAK